MSDFTSEELNIIGKAIEFPCGVMCSPEELSVLRKKIASMYVESLDPDVELCLIVGRHYMVKQADHRWHGNRVKLHRLETDTGLGIIRTWIINNSLETMLIPSSSLVECTG